MNSPLDGVRIVDLTRLLPGAYCTLVLADLGADVIKVEDPGGGDLVRTLAPLVDGQSVYHHALNRNKRSVTLDLRSPEARDLLDRLLATADVAIESFRPRTAERLGVSAADLQARHPKLVHCSLTGFGQTGPSADRAAHDLNFVALSGLFEVDQPTIRSPASGVRGPESNSDVGHRTSDHCEGSTPDAGRRTSDEVPHALHVPRLLVADIGAAWAAVAGILAALFRRERTGEASAVDIAIYDVAASWLTFPAAALTVAPPAAQSPRLPVSGDAACYNIYAAADGKYLALAAIEQKFWETFCTRVGHADLIPLQFVPSEQARLRDTVAAIFSTRSRDAWVEAFADVEVCLTPIRRIEDALRDPQLAVRRMVDSSGDLRFLRAPVLVTPSGSDEPKRTEATSPRVPLVPAAALGRDTDEVWRAVGLDADTLSTLRSRFVI